MQIELDLDIKLHVYIFSFIDSITKWIGSSLHSKSCVELFKCSLSAFKNVNGSFYLQVF